MVKAQVEVANPLVEARMLASRQRCAVLDVLGATLQDSDIERLCQATGVQRISRKDVSQVIGRGWSGPQDDVPWVLVDAADGQRLLMRDPWDSDAVAALVQRLCRYVEPAATSEAVLSDLMAEGGQRLSSSPSKKSDRPDSTAVELVDAALTTALQEGASDVHFECDRGGMTLKLRIDGVLTSLGRWEGRVRADEVISRIKVLAQLDITERRLPQDGRFRAENNGRSLDLRVSVMPSVHGEDAVLRLLDKSHLTRQAHRVDLASLGFEQEDADRLRNLFQRPSGMLLVTGPTGSGKTTTVYAALSEVNDGSEKIVTIEDPVEYELPGVLQIPVNERKGLTFARGLRSVLRHDPDRILVGEIRDAETASIAVQSALTGHAVFSTVHANSLADVLGRFRHFGIDVFGFAASLNGVVVQRLLRHVCPSCVSTRSVERGEREWLSGLGVSMGEVPLPVGCDRCRGAGYRGRFVVAEVHATDDLIRDLVVRGADMTTLKAAAFRDGLTPLLRRAARFVEAGATTMEEVLRVVGRE